MQTTFLPGLDSQNRTILSVLAKQTYAIKPGTCVISENQPDFTPADILDDPAQPHCAETIAECEFVAYKPSTDVIVIADACAPRGKKAFYVDCEVQVGPTHKTIRIFGDRHIESKALRGAVFSEPKAFERCTISYRNALGGAAKTKENLLLAFPPNPLGTGFSIKGGFDTVESIAVPSQEDPSKPLSPDLLICAKYENWTELPEPVSLGFTSRFFYPRYSYAGVLSPAASTGNSPTNQARIDPRFYQAAGSGLYGKQLLGGEQVVLKYLDPDYPSFEFVLPDKKPTLALDTGTGPQELAAMLQTVVIDMKKKNLTMIWQGAHLCESIEHIQSLSTIIATAI